MKVKGTNILVNFLALLGVRYTELFADQTFNEHPHKYNLYGLSKILTDYGIRNGATRIEDKENDIFKITCPFIAHTGGDFAAVYKVDLEKIYYLWNGKKLSVPVSDFIKSWSGVILLAEPSSDSGEPNYIEHRRKEIIHSVIVFILALTVILILGITYIYHTLYTDLGITLLLLVNLTGIFVCSMLVSKQLHIQSRYVDKICTLFSQSDCNNVLESEAAKLFSVFGWSEIGLGYFTTNFLWLMFFTPFLGVQGEVISTIALINFFALPFTIWSVWYQKVKVRQWCPLCLVVQVLLWVVFLVNTVFGYIQINNFQLSIINFPLFLTVGCTYVVLVFSLNLILTKLSEGNQVEQLRHEINSLKSNDEVFRTILAQQTIYEVDSSDSQISFGNPDSKLHITVLTNPYCNPCSKMHQRIEELLKQVNNQISVQYILSSFGKELDSTNKYLFAACLAKKNHLILSPQREIMQIFSDWFEKGKPLKDEYFKIQPSIMAIMNNPETKVEVDAEFQKHESWKEKTQLRATPTILINGYKLPDNYKIEDLRYFTDFNIDIK